MALNWLHDYAERWHDTWEIVGALAAAAAVIVALYLAWRDGRARSSAESERDQARAEAESAKHAALIDRWQTQAERVAVWTEEFPDDAGGGAYANDTGELIGPTIRRIIVMNYSDLPVFHLHVEHFAGVDAELASDIRPRLMPRDSASFDARDIELVGDGPRYEGIVFEDAAGRSWVRRVDGSPPIPRFTPL